MSIKEDAKRKTEERAARWRERDAQQRATLYLDRWEATEEDTAAAQRFIDRHRKLAGMLPRRCRLVN